jgi:DNA-binding MarR family transcriptional regulator
MRSELLDDLDDSISVIVRMIISNVHNQSVCVSPALDKTLLIVGYYDGIRIKELAAIMHVTSGAATQEVATLETDGWLTRAPNPKDHRETIVRLTAKGQKGLQKIRAARLERMTALFSSLNDKELKLFVDLIKKVSNSNGESINL